MYYMSFHVSYNFVNFSVIFDHLMYNTVNKLHAFYTALINIIMWFRLLKIKLLIKLNQKMKFRNL